ncbi:MAG: hypothetical protein U0271_48195 [Polyangiaceae bacterium]
MQPSRPPGTIPLTCAVTAYVLGFGSAAAMIKLLDRLPGLYVAVGLYACLAALVLDLVAFIGGVRGIFVARKHVPPAGIGRSVLALLMGLVGFIGVFALLLLTSLAAVAVH